MRDEREQVDGGAGAAGAGPADERLRDPREAPEEWPDRAEAGDTDEPLRDQLLRLAADFDNYRKREARERREAWSRAKADLIEKLLPAIDDLSRVAHPEVASRSGDGHLAGVLSGVELVERKLLQTLEREGLEPIEAEGVPFDPAVHEAVMTQPTDDPALDGRIAHVVLPGYRFAERLVRPAKVVVWKLSH